MLHNKGAKPQHKVGKKHTSRQKHNGARGLHKGQVQTAAGLIHTDTPRAFKTATNPTLLTPPFNADGVANAETTTLPKATTTPLTASGTAFRPTTPQHKFTRIIDASLSVKNQSAKKKVAEQFENSREELLRKHHDNEEFFHVLEEAEAQASRHKARIERKMRSKDTAHPFTAYNFSVTILGRPNVGKSSLFNRLTGKTMSMVHNSSGVTRDWNDSLGKLANLEFRIIDTAGLQEIDFSTLNPNLDAEKDLTHHKTGAIYGKAYGAAIHAEERSGTSNLNTRRNKSGKSKLTVPKSQQNSNYVLGRPLTPELQQSILDLTSRALELSDIVIFMIDAKAGITQQDIHFARWVRKQLHKKNLKSTLNQIEAMMSDKKGKSGSGGIVNTMDNRNINVAQINKLYELIAVEMVKEQERYRNDITLFPIQEFFKQTHVDYDDIVHVNHTNRSFLRSIHTKPVLLLANKFDHGDTTQDYKVMKQNRKTGQVEEELVSVTAEENLLSEVHQLGFGPNVEPLPFSAVHGVGLGELYSKVVYSMSDVLKQWDTYQKKVKYIIDVKNEFDNALKLKQTKERKLAQIRLKQQIREQEEALAAAQLEAEEKAAALAGKPLSRRDKMLINRQRVKDRKRAAREAIELAELNEALANDEELKQFRTNNVKLLQGTGLHDNDVQEYKAQYGMNSDGEFEEFEEFGDEMSEEQQEQQQKTKLTKNAKSSRHHKNQSGSEEQSGEGDSYDDDNDDDVDQEYDSQGDMGSDEGSYDSQEDDGSYDDDEEEQDDNDPNADPALAGLSKQERRKLRRLKKDQLPLDPSMVPDENLFDVELPQVRDALNRHKPDTTDEKQHQVKFVLVGKPNAGKSTTMNALLGENRVLTGAQAGVTRDSIEIQYDDDAKFPNHSFHLVDTAGLKGITAHKHSKFDLVDSHAMQNTVKKIQQANVVGLVIDIAEGLYGNTGVDPVFTHQIQKNFIENVQAMRYDEKYEKAKAAGASEEELALIKRKNSAEKSAYDDKLSMMVSRVAGCVTKHDMDIARLTAEHGKALLVLANKIDCLKGGQKEIDAVMKGLLALFSFTYSQNKGVTVVPMSAMKKTNVPTIMTKVTSLYDKWDSRINTGLLNRWLQALMQMSPPPSVGMKNISLKYITQTNTRPPTFALFVNRKTEFPQHYERFIRNSLTTEFGLQGVPIRLNIRTGENPYVENRTISNAEKFHIKKRRERDEITKIKQQRSGKNSRLVYEKLTRQAKQIDKDAAAAQDPDQVEQKAAPSPTPTHEYAKPLVFSSMAEFRNRNKNTEDV